MLFYIIAILFSLIALYYTYFSGQILDILIQKPTLSELIKMCIILGGIGIVNIIIGYFVNIFNTKITLNVSKGISEYNVHK